MLTPIVAMIVLLGVLVFIHELGHFLFAKLFNIGVEVFSIGFGPKLFSFKRGETLYQVALIPLGGYVKLIGNSRDEEIPKRFQGKEMYNRAPWKRLIVLAAGPVFNLILAVFIFASLSYKGIKVSEPIIGHTFLGEEAEKSGLKPGDKILSIDGKKLESWVGLQQQIYSSPGKALQFSYEREGNQGEIRVVPEKRVAKNHLGEEIIVGKIGIFPGYLKPILTVKDGASFAYKIGLRTGDRLKSLEYFNSENKLVKIETDFWHQLRAAQKLILKDKPKKIFFVLRKENSKTVVRKIESKVLDYKKLAQDNLWDHFGIFLSTLVISLSEKEAKGTLLKNNDVLTSFNGIKIESYFDLREILEKNKKARAQISVVRDGAPLELSVNLEPKDRQTLEGKKTVHVFNASFPLLNLEPLPFRIKYADSVLSAVGDGVRGTYYMSISMVQGLWQLVTGRISLKALGGPIMIAKVAGDSIQVGLERFFEIMALISINLAIVNFIPIPVLDGGRMVIVCIEWLRRKEMSYAALENFNKIGFVLILSLFVLSTYNDLSRYWVSMVKSLMGLLQ